MRGNWRTPRKGKIPAHFDGLKKKKQKSRKKSREAYRQEQTTCRAIGGHQGKVRFLLILMDRKKKSRKKAEGRTGENRQLAGYWRTPRKGKIPAHFDGLIAAREVEEQTTCWELGKDAKER